MPEDTKNEFYFLIGNKNTGEYVGTDRQGNPVRAERAIGEKRIILYSPKTGDLEKAVLNDFVKSNIQAKGANAVFIDPCAGKISERKGIGWYQAYLAVKVKRK